MTCTDDSIPDASEAVAWYGWHKITAENYQQFLPLQMGDQTVGCIAHPGFKSTQLRHKQGFKEYCFPYRRRVIMDDDPLWALRGLQHKVKSADMLLFRGGKNWTAVDQPGYSRYIGVKVVEVVEYAYGLMAVRGRKDADLIPTAASAPTPITDTERIRFIAEQVEMVDYAGPGAPDDECRIRYYNEDGRLRRAFARGNTRLESFKEAVDTAMQYYEKR